ncbi:MAG: formate dehydrogenase accessory sulfurtransferase FdhD [Roseiflexus sp.]
MFTVPNVQRRTVIKARDGRWIREKDTLVVEEPLEIRLTISGVDGCRIIPLTTIMRTPSEDFELAAGFLLGEGIVRERHEITTIRYCTDAMIDEEAR